MRRRSRLLKKFPAAVAETLTQLAPATPIEVWFQDEMRVGQKNSLVYQWAKTGTRPRQPKDQHYENAYLFGAVCPSRDTGIAARTDRAEQIGVFIVLILRLARPRARLRPLVDKTVLLPDAHFVLEPHLDWRCGRKLRQRLGDSGGKLFLKVAIACASCAGCWGRALMCEKPSFLSARPRLTAERSTPKRSPRTRFKSTQRQRTTPSFSGSGPASTSWRKSSSCSLESVRGRPDGLMLISPSGPRSLKRCTQSRSVWRSMPPMRAASSRSIPSQTAASARSLRAWSASFAFPAKRRNSSVSKSSRSLTGALIQSSRIKA